MSHIRVTLDHRESLEARFFSSSHFSFLLICTLALYSFTYDVMLWFLRFHYQLHDGC